MNMLLEGIRVLEMAAYVAAPATAVILSDFGAEVIKVEPPDGDPHRRVLETGIAPTADFNYLFEAFNRNKKSIGIDAKNDQGKEIIHRLVGQSDIFISNFRQPAIDKLSIDYGTLSVINPKLIYAHITGYGPRGPGKDWPAFDETAFWARSGIMSLLGEPDSPSPSLHGAIGDLTTSLGVFGSIMLALYHREKTGQGQRIDSSLLGTGAWVVGWDLQANLYTGKDIPRLSRKKKANPLHNTYMTKDGRWVQFSMAQTDRYWPIICRALDREDLLKDNRFSSHKKRCQNSELITSILDEIMATKNLAEIKDRFYREGMVWAPAQTLSEVADDPQLAANEVLIEYEHPTIGQFRSIDSPIKLGKSIDKVKKPAPILGQHTGVLLQRLGYLPEQIKELKRNKVVV